MTTGELILSIGLLSLTATAAGKTPYDNLCGIDLAKAVATNAAPQRLLTRYTGTGSITEAFLTTDPADGGIYDRFSGQSFVLSTDMASAYPEFEIIQIIPGKWWAAGESESDDFKYDLVNLLPANMDVSANKRDYPPGTVTKAIYDNGVWSSGTGSISGVDINCYQPPKGYEGDFARVCFYMITLHQSGKWHHSATNFLESTNLPCLKAWAVRQLLAWHQSDPPDSREIDRDNAIEAIQGNHNPFIRHQALARYIFGDKFGQPFEDAQDSDIRQRPLSSRYSISDKWIWLKSPYIPQDAVWSVDGIRTDSDRIATEELGVGTHTLRYSSPSERGILKITVEP